MSDSSRLRVVDPEPARPARPRHGPAVVLISLSALALIATLWLLRAGSPLFRRAASRAAPAEPAAPSRAALLAGASLAPVARAELFRRVSGTCCTCGCDLNLRDCLLADQACSKSVAAARAIADELR